MGFYYVSTLSIFPLAIAYGVLALLFWGIARMTREMRGRNVLLCVIGVVLVLIPVAEELWIAWSFGQKCKVAGTNIIETAQVDGYYDDTQGGTMTRLVGRPSYRFIESRDRSGKYQRIEHASSEEKAHALAWYSEKVGKKLGDKEWITHSINEQLHVTVEMDTGFAWRITKLDRPMARYHYKVPHSHTQVAHKIVKHEAVVLDTASGSVIAKYTRFSRNSPWFYVSLGKSDFSCDAPNRWPLTRGSFLIYRDVLIPSSAK